MMVAAQLLIGTGIVMFLLSLGFGTFATHARAAVASLVLLVVGLCLIPAGLLLG